MASIREQNGTVFLDAVIEPGEQRDLDLPAGTESLGYYIDQQFDLETAGAFVEFTGSDGSESGSATGAVITPANGTDGIDFHMVNRGKEVRRVLVYVTRPNKSE